MAHGPATMAATAYPKPLPHASISWDDSHKDVKVKGSLGKVKIGQELYIVMRGKVVSCNHSDYGCSLSLELNGLEVDPAKGNPPVGTESAKEEKAEGDKPNDRKDMFTLIKEHGARPSRGGR